MTVLRWGIASAGKISHDFCVAISTLSAEEHRVVAVAARDQQRAEEFAKKHGIATAYGSYEELAKNPDVDIVYIGSLNPQHLEMSRLMLEHGKHVLCEKPLCMNRRQAEQLIEYAHSKKLFLMEAVWSRFFPAYNYVQQQIKAGSLGPIQEVDVCFGFPLVQVDRVAQKDLGGGVILDLGIYTIQVSQFAFQEAPEKVIAKGTLNEEGVDIDMKAELLYAGGRKATMHCSALGKLENRAIIRGTKGQITILNFWCPTAIIDIDGQQKEWPLPSGSYPTNFPNSEGLRYEADAVRKVVLEGGLQHPQVSHKESLLFAQIQDEIRKQLGVTFKEDE